MHPRCACLREIERGCHLVIPDTRAYAWLPSTHRNLRRLARFSPRAPVKNKLKFLPATLGVCASLQRTVFGVSPRLSAAKNVRRRLVRFYTEACIKRRVVSYEPRHVGCDIRISSPVSRLLPCR